MTQPALNPGDLVLAAIYTSGKAHISRFEKYRTQAVHGSHVKPLSPAVASMFCCAPLCDMRSQDKYYWQIYDDNGEHRSDDFKCRACFAAWNRMGRPKVIGFTLDDVAPADHPRLAFAWKEVPAVGHPSDKGGKEKDRDVDEAPRLEVRRWERGRRYVRLVEFREGDYTHGVFVGFYKDDLRFRGPLGKCLKKVSVIMAMGGDT